MVYVTAKRTGRIVGRELAIDTIDQYLRMLPSGVYSIDDADGNEINLVTVKSGRVTYAR